MTTHPTFNEYPVWLATHHGVEHGEVTERWYSTNLVAITTQVKQHPFTLGLDDQLRTLGQIWTQERGGDLLMDSSKVVGFVTKPYKSALDKSYRQNILWNKKFPDPPDDSGWITPFDWFSRFNDTVRTTVVTKYLDGPEWLCSKLQEYASQHRMESFGYSQQKDVGYYAYHFYVSFPIDVVDRSWSAMRVMVKVEIQITTQLQDVLRSLTHSFYSMERTRVDAADESQAWQWQHKTPRFRARYLSHTLHMLEALVVELRDAARESTHDPRPPDAAALSTLAATQESELLTTDEQGPLLNTIHTAPPEARNV